MGYSDSRMEAIIACYSDDFSRRWNIFECLGKSHFALLLPSQCLLTRDRHDPLDPFVNGNREFND